MTQLAFEPFGEPVEVRLYPGRRRPEISLVRSAPPCAAEGSPLERAIARCERAAEECETMARSANKARNASWAAYGATKRIKESA